VCDDQEEEEALAGGGGTKLSRALWRLLGHWIVWSVVPMVIIVKYIYVYIYIYICMYVARALAPFRPLDRLERRPNYFLVFNFEHGV